MSHTLRTSRLLAVLVLLLGTAAPSAAQRFMADDPLWFDPDSTDAPPPTQVETSAIYDFLENTFSSPDDYTGPALDVNTMGEVPNSSWYAMRHYYEPMSIDALKRGPNRTGGPAMEGRWRVVDIKNEGKSIGFEVVDEQGDLYMLKFDPVDYMELSTGAEVVSTKLFYALGYHVPENYAVRFDASQLVPDTSEGVSEADIEAVLEKAPAYEDGSYRALASLFLQGEDIIGPFLYYGTRPDDANDIFRHEGRRSLRGMRLFAAWTNHFDARSANTLDVVKEVGGDTFVVHHLIDFGSTLGGGPGGPMRRWTGYEYTVEWDRIMQRALSLGLLGSDWQRIEYEERPSVGRFEAEHFDARTWRPQYPNPAFQNMDGADAFWAAKQVMHFTDEEIRAVVESADYSDPEAADYIVSVLAERRDKIGEAFLHYGGGLDRFEVVDGDLVFEDLPARYGWAPEERTRHVIWRPFFNEEETTGEVLFAGQRAGTRVPVPDSDEEYLVAELRTPDRGMTRVYLRLTAGGREVVGVERSDDVSGGQ